MSNRSTAQLIEREQKKPILVVTHENPDTDAWACYWLICDQFGSEREVELCFVPAGNRLSDDDPDWQTKTIYHVDTGCGEHDQHGKELTMTSSFELLAKDFGVEFDPAVQTLIPMVNAVDNAKTIDPTSIHYFFTSLPYTYNNQGNKWSLVGDQVLFVLDSMASKWRADVAVAAKFAKVAVVETLPNGMKYCELRGRPNLRHEAFKRGAHVVFWTAPVKGGFFPAMQVSEHAHVDLTQLAAKLRAAEAEVRSVSTAGLNLEQFSQVEGIPGWFLHDSRRLIMSGSKSHPLTGDALTKIKEQRISVIVRSFLSEAEL